MLIYLSTNSLRVYIFLMDILWTYLGWWIHRMTYYMEWKVMIVMCLYKYSFNLLTGIYCQMRYGMHSWKSVTFLKIYALTSCIPNTWRSFKQISSRQSTNFWWYFPSFFGSIEHLPIYLLFEVKVEGIVNYRWMYSFERLRITHAS